MATIELKGGGTAQVDERDVAKVSKHEWTKTKTTAGIPRARTLISKTPKWNFAYLHRFVVGAGKGDYVVPKNGDYLDCRRSNLKVQTAEERIAEQAREQTEAGAKNKKVFTETIAGRYKPYASTKPSTKGWTVSVYIGTFPTRDEAVEQYDAACEAIGFTPTKRKPKR